MTYVARLSSSDCLQQRSQSEDECYDTVSIIAYKAGNVKATF